MKFRLRSLSPFRYITLFMFFAVIACSSNDNEENDRTEITELISDKWWVSDQGSYIRRLRVDSDGTMFFNSVRKSTGELITSQGKWSWDNGVFKVDNAVGAIFASTYYVLFTDITSTTMQVSLSEERYFSNIKFLYEVEQEPN